MNLFKNKKGVDLIHGTVIFLVLNLIFFGLLFGFVFRTGNDVALYEQEFSKELSLLIDKSKPGTVIFLDLKEIRGFLEEGELYDRAFNFDNNKVTVKLTKGSKGYSFPYFSNYKITSSFQPGEEEGDLFLGLAIG